jgi:epoxyqueuosine reductase
MSTSSSLMEDFQKAVQEAGIDLVGATTAEPLPSRGYAHQQPKEYLSGARSVVIAGYCSSYEPRITSSEPGKPRGRFAAYGSRVFDQMERFCMDTMAGFLQSRGFSSIEAPRIPIKPAVVRAGLGGYGKHSVVVTPMLGSMVMFACVVTDAPLHSGDEPLYESKCPEKCTLCIDACPTGAITAPFAIDPSKCVTEWLWGTFAPVELRAKQENRLFGCAECLFACPRNTRVRPRCEYPITTDEVDDSPELIPLLTGDAEYYRRIIPTFPMRAGIDSIRGNAIIALGNIGDPMAVEGLRQTLRHEKTQLRAYSAWALGRIGTPDARAIVEAARAAETDPAAAAEMERALE